MYGKLNITENHLQVLSLFTKGFDRGHYIREVEKLLGMSPRTAQLILDSMENKGVLESITEGRTRMYALKKNEISRKYMILAELFKTIAFLEKNLIAAEVVEKITPFIKGIGVIFGSYAKGAEKRGSDLDVFVAGECERDKVKKISETYDIEVSVKAYPLKIFAREIRNDLLIKEVLADHIVFLNAERFVNEVMKNG